jgi:hypothetical protein
LNKTTKIRLNYALGTVVSVLLLWGVYVQVSHQLDKVDIDAAWQTGPMYFLWLCILLMPVNQMLEAKKWHLLAGYAQPLSYKQALYSYFAGTALSLVTPNRIGDYPGRLLYLKRKNTLRLIGVSFLGAIAQMLTAFLFGLAGLIYYNQRFPGTVQTVVMISCGIITVLVAVVYWKFDVWMPLIEKIKRLKRYNVYVRLLDNITARKQLTILLITITRYIVYTAQYLLLLYWMKIDIPLMDGFLMSGLFFWLIAVIPSMVLMELGERSQVGLYLFHHFSDNSIGILTATIGIWAINLIIPAVLGSILLFRARYVE